MKQITDHGTMKRHNQLTILRAVRDLGPVSRVKLQKETHVSWGTITSSVKELLDKRIVRELGSVYTGVGRRPVELDMNTDHNFVVGLRLGGANIHCALLDVKGRAIHDLEDLVSAHEQSEVILRELFAAVDHVLEQAAVSLDKVAGIGIAAPGAIDIESGSCLYAPHHPRWRNVPLKKRFEDRYRVPCFVDHVNNCFALGEKLFGAGKGISNFLCVLLGTGISAGIIINDEVYRGVDCASGEFGHISFNPEGPTCACGKKGCLETYASGPAIARMGIKAVNNNQAPMILELADGKVENITGETVFEAARKGAPEALEIFDTVGYYLGLGLSALINLFNPECIILCGGVSQSHEFFLPTLKKIVSERAWPQAKKNIQICTLNHGAVFGAAGVVLKEIYEKGLLFDRQYLHPRERSAAIEEG